MSDRWSEKSLNELAAIEKGSVVPTQSDNSRDAVPYIGAENFTGAFSQFTCDPAAVTCEETDVLMLWDGERSGLCAKNLRGAIGSTVARLRPKNHVDSGFLYYGLSNKFEWIQARRTGTGVPHVPKDLGTWLRIIVPNEVAEQRRIAFVLDTIDEAISKTEAVIAKLKQVRAGLRHDLLTCGLDENGELRDPGVHPEQFKNTPVGRIPKEWEVDRLASVAKVLSGKRLPHGRSYAELPTGYRYLRVIDFFERDIEFDKLERLDEATFKALERFEIKDGDLFISIAGSLGCSGVLRNPTSERIVLTENAARIKIESDFIPEYLAFQINGPLVQRQISAEEGIGAGVPKLALFRIESLLIPHPRKSEQESVVRAMSAFDERLDSEVVHLGKLRKLKSGLMSDLLTGSVRVPEEMGNQINSPKA